MKPSGNLEISDPLIPSNLAQMFFERVDISTDKTALRFKQDGGNYRDVSYREFANIVQSLSLVLKRKGVKKGDRVCILSENRPGWFYSDMAILSLGAVTVPIYPTSSPAECSYIINDCDAEVLFISTQEQWDRLSDEMKKCTKLKWVVSLNPVNTDGHPVFFQDLIQEAEASVDENEIRAWREGIDQVGHEDLATIIYTSGTTGAPKGVMLTHGNLLSNIWGTARGIQITETDILLSILPLSHVFERMAGYYLQVYIGTTVALVESIQTAAVNMLEVRPTIVNAVPRFFEKIRENILEEVRKRGAFAKKLFDYSIKVGKRFSKFQLSGEKPPFLLTLIYQAINLLVYSKVKNKLGGRIRFFVSGGAPLSKDIAEFFYAIDVLILEGYGLTETSPVVSVNRLDQFRFGSVGMPLENVRVKIAEDGEIMVKGPSVMRGYYKLEEETKKVMRDGWFLTGDIGRFDSDGFLYITDRKKDLIKTSGGKYVIPQKIEGLLAADDWIAQAFIYGDQRKFIVGLIVPDFQRVEQYAREHNIQFRDKNDLLEKSEIKKLFDQRIHECQKDLAEFEKVKYFSFLPEQMSLESGELTPTLKMKRRVVVEKNKDLIEKMYQEAERQKAR